MDNDKIIIYTDGACSGNPGKGGWGAVLLYQDHRKEISGYEKDTTNNRMEITAIIEAIKLLKKEKTIVQLYTDSKYVKDGIEKWIHNWKKNGWKTANKKPVKNKDLWLSLDELVNQHTISWHWVKGHNGNIENENADSLARLAIQNKS